MTVIYRGYHARYLRSGHLIYGLDHNLMAIAFDVTRQATTGQPATIVAGIHGIANPGAAYVVSQSGTLVYALAEPPPQRVLTWVDRNGHEQPFDMPPGDYARPKAGKSDGTRIAFLAGTRSDRPSVLDMGYREPTT